jgi:thioesterase domain-containing protein
LAGYSLGGLIALEMAGELAESGASIECLVLLDTYVHEGCLSPWERRRLAVSRPFWLSVNGLRDPRGKLPRFLRRLGGRPADQAGEEVDLPPLLRFIEQVNNGAYEAYRPRTYDGPAIVVRARVRERRQCEPRPVLARAITGGLRIERVPGGHLELMREPHVRRVAEVVSASLIGGDG